MTEYVIPPGMGREVTDEERERLKNNFTYHAPTGDQPERYNIIRGAAQGLGWIFLRLCPPSRELSLAMTALEEAVMWANASIARSKQ